MSKKHKIKLALRATGKISVAFIMIVVGFIVLTEGGAWLLSVIESNPLTTIYIIGGIAVAFGLVTGIVSYYRDLLKEETAK